jgi:LmbE family N-acetylglucosaminyl deacetylase
MVERVYSLLSVGGAGRRGIFVSYDVFALAMNKRVLESIGYSIGKSVAWSVGDNCYDDVVVAGVIGNCVWPRWVLSRYLNKISLGGRMHILERSADGSKFNRLLGEVHWLLSKVISSALRRLRFGDILFLSPRRVTSEYFVKIVNEFDYLHLCYWGERKPFLKGSGIIAASVERDELDYFGYLNSEGLEFSVWQSYFRENYAAWLGVGGEVNFGVEEIQMGDEAFLESKFTVAVIAPHPDDELIGCGGLISRVRQAGGRVCVLHVTNGSSSYGLYGHSDEERKRMRGLEALKVSQEAGWECSIGSIDDALSGEGLEQVQMLIQDFLVRIDPDIVLAPFEGDAHYDHQVVALALARVLDCPDYSRRCQYVLSYEVWGLVSANWMIDIEKQVPEIFRLLAHYAVALRVTDYFRLIGDLALFRGFGLLQRRCFYEAFRKRGISEYISEVKGTCE